MAGNMLVTRKKLPWYSRALMSKNRALGKKAGSQQSEASSRNFFWGAEIRDLTPSCLGRPTLRCDVITDHLCRKEEIEKLNK